MEIWNFVKLDTDGKGEKVDGGIILKDWTYLHVSLIDGITKKFRTREAFYPKKVKIRDRMLILDE